MIEFEVDGLPPKKDGASSMWTKPGEAPKVRRLRESAAAAIAGAAPFEGPVEVELEARIGPKNGRAVGDLDNFITITGVLDALQAAPAGTPWESSPAWREVAAGAAPDRPLVLVDDVLVVRIIASKVEGDGPQRYRVRVQPHVPHG